MSDPTPAVKASAVVKPSVDPTPDPTQQTTRKVDEEGHVERHGAAGWIERSAWFPVRHARHALAGALHGLAADDLITQGEAQKLLDKYVARPEPKS